MEGIRGRESEKTFLWFATTSRIYNKNKENNSKNQEDNFSFFKNIYRKKKKD